MRFGAHLPLIDFGDHPFSLDRLVQVTHTARETGYTMIVANDHVVFSAPWLDGLTALASVLHASGELALGTTVALPVHRGPAVLAKALSSLDVLSGGRLVVGLGPGSSARDYEVVGIPFAERWLRFDEAVRAVRVLLHGQDGFAGRWYDTRDVRLAPRSEPTSPRLWIASWGSDAGLRRVARQGDGWLASAYNTTPQRFAASLARLMSFLEAEGRDPAGVSNALATTMLHLADSRREAERVLADVVAPVLRRPVRELHDRLAIGTVDSVREMVAEYAGAGLHQMLLWPVIDETTQLAAFMREVAPVATND